jgi:uncharacterized protein (DUF58 family)
MNQPALREKAKKIAFWAKKLSSSFSPGDYLTLFHGQGMEYEESRHYSSGDDLRRIDWKVTARANHPYVKVFREEREVSFLVLLDVSRSLFFGTGVRSKIEVASELAALLALIAERRGDRVGVVLFSDRVHFVELPRKGSSHVRAMVDHILSQASFGQKTSLTFGIEQALALLKRRSFVLLISDFLDRDYEKALTKISSLHDVVAAKITDDGGAFQIEDIGLQGIDLESGMAGVFSSEGEDQSETIWKSRIQRTGSKAIVLKTSDQTDRVLHDFMKRRRRS